MGSRTLIYYLYPRLIALHDLDNQIALPQIVEMSDGSMIESVLMPACTRNSYYFMEANGVYLIGVLTLGTFDVRIYFLVYR